MSNSKETMGFRIIGGLAVIAVVVSMVLLIYRGGGMKVPDVISVFDGDSGQLQATRVLPTLDIPIPKGTNAVWCASFLSAWKTLEAEVIREPPSLQGDPEGALALNRAPDPRPLIPEASLYVAAGWNHRGIVDQIRADLAKRFPAKAQPEFSGMTPDSLVAYAYLEANVKFTYPYFQNRKPLVFSDSSGKKTDLSSFGIRPEDEYAYDKLRRQAAILFIDRAAEIPSTDESFLDLRAREFAVDLDRSSNPIQIVLALVAPKPTLGDVLDYVEAQIAKDDPAGGGRAIGPNDVLFVPDMVWRISHRFNELEGRSFTNPALEGKRLDIAQQDILFRLDRSGAELKSESKMYCLPIPTYFLIDRPFLLYMKKRDAKSPFFALWIDNAELLNRWLPGR